MKMPKVNSWRLFWLKLVGDSRLSYRAAQQYSHRGDGHKQLLQTDLKCYFILIFFVLVWVLFVLWGFFCL